MLMPGVFTTTAARAAHFTLTQTLRATAGAGLRHWPTRPAKAASRRRASACSGASALASGARLELDGGVGGWRSHNDEHAPGVSHRRDDAAAHAATTDNDARGRRQPHAQAHQLAGRRCGRWRRAAASGSEHSLVAGAEVEACGATKTRVTLENGVPQLAEFGDDLQASSAAPGRLCAGRMGLNAELVGARRAALGGHPDPRRRRRRQSPSNRSSVWTPLVHLLWKPDPKARDQVRLSLTRSYRAPAPSHAHRAALHHRRYPADGPNEPTSPDSAGNPRLQPELASGVDLAFERYLQGGGLLSANLFDAPAQRRHPQRRRRWKTVSWSPVPRWVSRPQNVGDAGTQGLELEAKFRLDQLIDDAARRGAARQPRPLPVQRRRHARPRQPARRPVPGDANLGADYRLRSLPLGVGGNFNWVPAYRTQLAADRAATVGRKTRARRLCAVDLQPGGRLAPDGQQPGAAYYETTPVRRRLTARNLAQRSPSYSQWQCGWS